MSFTSGLGLEVDESRLDEFQSYEKKPVSPKQCETVVTQVKASGVYTEESIEVICTKELKTSGCAFFAEALALASSHSDYKGQTFCGTMEEAQFCSDIMDKLLESRPVSDMAFGECERATPRKSEEYCRKIQQMLALSVKQEDLDTMRACYMMEAYTNQTMKDQPQKMLKPAGPLNAGGKGKATAPHAKATGVSRKLVPLDNFGKGKAVKGFTPADKTFAQPQPLESIGKGEGNMTKPKTIVAEPKASPAGKDEGDATKLQPKSILAEPKPAPLETSGKAEAAPKDIITEPVPSTQSSITTGLTVAHTSALKGSVVAVPVPSLPVAQTPQQKTAAIVQQALQQPAARTVYVISMPAAAPNASAAATATQRQQIVAQVIAASQSGVKMPVAQVATALATAQAKGVAAAARVISKPASKPTETSKAVASKTKSVAARKTTAKTALIIHKVEKAESAATATLVAFAKNRALKEKKSFVGKIMGLFVDSAVVEHPEVRKKAIAKPAKAVKKNAVQVEKKSDYGGFLSGFVN